MAPLSLCPQSETNLMLNRKVIEPLLQLNSAKAHGKNYMKVKPYLVRHLLRDRLLEPTAVKHTLKIPIYQFFFYWISSDKSFINFTVIA